MLRLSASILAFALVGVSGFSSAHADQPAYSSFQSELSSALSFAQANNRLVSVSTGGGDTFIGKIIKVMPDAIMLKRNSSSYLIRIDRINAISWDAAAPVKTPQ